MAEVVAEGGEEKMEVGVGVGVEVEALAKEMVVEAPVDADLDSGNPLPISCQRRIRHS